MASPAQGARMKAVDRTATSLRLAILRGDHAAGENLPPERGLAEHHGVSRLTLRAALSRLENEGLVQPVQGSGNRVLDFRTSGGLELLGPLLRVALGGDQVPLGLLSQLLEVRRALAGETLAMVARHAADDELESLEAQLHGARPMLDAPADFMAWDLGFARTLIQASGNLPLQLLFNTVSRTLQSQSGAEVLFSAPDPRATVAVYGRLVEKLRQRDPRAAHRLADRLLERHDRRLIEGLRAVQPQPEAHERRAQP